MNALLNWRLWAVVILVTLLAATHWRAYNSGQKQVRAEWAVEKLAQAEESASVLANAAIATAALQAKSDQLRKTKNAQIEKLDADLATALDRLHDRAARPDAGSVPSNTSAQPASGCTGAQLYKPDAEFLTRESDRSQRVLAELAECQTAHQNARESLTR